MKSPQLITIGIALLLVAGIYLFGRTIPKKKKIIQTEQHGPNDGHDHGPVTTVTIDTILLLAKKDLTPDQAMRISALENSVSRGNIKDQQIHVYHQLSRFWADSIGIFEPYAWYQAEAARLENSEKTLNFAAQLFLDNLQNDAVAERKRWKALQAKDLFERSLKINPANDSAKVGIGATYLFGDISSSPMEGISKIREVVAKDSSNVYAQMVLGKASLVSGQYDKAISRFETVNRIDPKNLEATLLLADVFERTGKKKVAVDWYRKSLSLVEKPDLKEAISQRIAELSK